MDVMGREMVEERKENILRVTACTNDIIKSYGALSGIYGHLEGRFEKKLRQKIKSQIKKTAAGKKVEIELDENDTNTLIASMVVKSSKNHKYLRAIKASKTSIKEGNLDFGIVVNASDIIEDIREEETVKTGPSIINIPGFFKDKEVYLGLLGKYGLKNGQLKLDPNGKIKIGALSFSMGNALKKLGISEDSFRRAIKDLKIGKLDSGDIGQMNKYIGYWRRHKQYEHEQPTIGLIICREAGREEVIYALDGLEEKIFIAKYKVKLPSEAKIKKAIRDL